MKTKFLLVISLVLAIMLTGTGVATAAWIIAANTTTRVAAGELTTSMNGASNLTSPEISTTNYSTPIELTLENPNPVPVDYTLMFAPQSGTLGPAEIGLAVWQPAGSNCPSTVPETGISTGTLANPPTLTLSGNLDATSTICAATRFAGTLFGSADKFLTVTPTVTAQLTEGEWTATAPGEDFTLTMAPAPDPVTVRCENNDSLLGLLAAGVDLRWDPVEGAEAYLVETSAGFTTTVDTNHAELTLINLLSRPDSVTVTALGQTGNSTPAPHGLRTQLLGFPIALLTLRCRY